MSVFFSEISAEGKMGRRVKQLRDPKRAFQDQFGVEEPLVFQTVNFLCYLQHGQHQQQSTLQGFLFLYLTASPNFSLDT